jgi:hypothetical protein
MKIISKSVSHDSLGQRVTTYAVEGVRRTPKAVYAICVESDGPEYLTPSKLYRVQFSGEFATVTDDQGERAVYPANFFVPVSLSKETRHRIETALSL